MSKRAPQVGDVAEHLGGLDPRPVVRVEKIGGRWFVGLKISDATTAWPCPASNYRFRAPVTA